MPSNGCAFAYNPKTNVARWELEQQEKRRLRQLADVRSTVQQPRPKPPRPQPPPPAPSGPPSAPRSARVGPAELGSQGNSAGSSPCLMHPRRRARSMSPMKLEPIAQRPEVQEPHHPSPRVVYSARSVSPSRHRLKPLSGRPPPAAEGGSPRGAGFEDQPSSGRAPLRSRQGSVSSLDREPRAKPAKKPVELEIPAEASGKPLSQSFMLSPGRRGVDLRQAVAPQGDEEAEALKAELEGWYFGDRGGGGSVGASCDIEGVMQQLPASPATRQQKEPNTISARWAEPAPLSPPGPGSADAARESSPPSSANVAASGALAASPAPNSAAAIQDWLAQANQRLAAVLPGAAKSPREPSPEEGRKAVSTAAAVQAETAPAVEEKLQLAPHTEEKAQDPPQLEEKVQDPPQSEKEVEDDPHIDEVAEERGPIVETAAELPPAPADEVGQQATFPVVAEEEEPEVGRDTSDETPQTSAEDEAAEGEAAEVNTPALASSFRNTRKSGFGDTAASYEEDFEDDFEEDESDEDDASDED